MKIEEQVSNLELSEELCKLGVPQDSVWYWITNGYCKVHVREKTFIDIFKKGKNKCIFYSAFTVAELGKMLPKNCFTENMGTFYRCCCKEALDNKGYYIAGKDNVEANARAKMLIYLIKQGLIKPQDLTEGE